LGFADAAISPRELVASVQTAGVSDELWAAGAAQVVPPVDLDPAQVADDLSAIIDELWSRL
jgi:hypothetical protein